MGNLAYEAGPSDVALLDETIPANLWRTIDEHGDREALVAVHQGIQWTYQEFGERVTRLAKGLLAAGLEVGDRVGLWAPNYAEWTLVQYATAEIGVILVNINPAYRTHELAYALNQSGCKWVIAAPEFKSSN
jgi:fatty-acyl-CoA synthase